MATKDYDATRKSEEEVREEQLETLRLAAAEKVSSSNVIDVDEAEAAERFELPGADLSNEELAVVVQPQQESEFTCGVCFLIRHSSQRAPNSSSHDQLLCVDCA